MNSVSYSLNMNVYRGDRRRQVGGNLFSTAARGIKPLLLALLAKLKPHLMDAGKALGKKAAKAALDTGANMASNYMVGRLDAQKAKNILKSEIKGLATDVAQDYKRKIEDKLQIGSGKRRKLNRMKSKTKTSKKNINKRRKSRKTCKTKRCNRKRKLINRRKPKKNINKRKIKRKLFKDIFGK